MSWNIGSTKNIFLGLGNKYGIYHVYLKDTEEKFTLTLIEYTSLPKLEHLDVESQISEFEWVLFNGRRKIIVKYRNDLEEIVLTVSHTKGYQWIPKQKITIHKDEYTKLLEKIPNILSFVNTFSKTCIHLEEDTQ